MSNVIKIHRQHPLGLPTARKIAILWVQKAKEKFDLTYSYQEGATQDIVHFSRPGIQGTLKVSPEQFELEAALGFLFSAFKHRIESEMNEQFNTLLKSPPQSA